MIKYLGSVGAFVRLNDSSTGAYDFLTVYSSSALTTALFSSSVENSSGSVVFSGSGIKSYINGIESSTLPNQEWAHFAFSFDTKLMTNDTNNFIVRFGDQSAGDFNIQNVYIMDSSLSASAIGYLHKEFTGAGQQIIRVNDSASYSVNFIDAPETNYTSSDNKYIYQPLKNQLRFDRNVIAASTESLNDFISASVMINDDLYVDGYSLSENDFVLSLEDNIIYQLTASSYLTAVSSTDGDIVKILFGATYGGSHYLYASGSFTLAPTRIKVASYETISDTNNP